MIRANRHFGVTKTAVLSAAGRCAAGRHGQQGAALIEALVAILILSIGLLGMIGLQTAAVRYESNSWARSAVAAGVADIADRIRANPGAAADAYAITHTYEDERAEIDGSSSYLDPSVNCLTTTCGPAQLAEYDLALWRAGLNRQMPGAVGFITGTRNTAYNVTVAWFDRSWVDAADALQTSAQCVANMDPAAARTCCPADLAAPPGVRCVNFAVVP